MKKEWEFELKLFVESEDQPVGEHIVFYDEDSTIEITDLSEKLKKAKDPYPTKPEKNWSAVKNPMELHELLVSMGDQNTLSFRPVWDGGHSASILRSFVGQLVPKAELHIFRAGGPSAESSEKKFSATPIVEFTLAPAHIQFAEYEPYIGGERFAVRFGALRSKFNSILSD